jgi:hypothetical protein
MRCMCGNPTMFSCGEGTDQEQAPSLPASDVRIFFVLAQIPFSSGPDAYLMKTHWAAKWLRRVCRTGKPRATAYCVCTGLRISARDVALHVVKMCISSLGCYFSTKPALAENGPHLTPLFAVSVPETTAMGSATCVRIVGYRDDAEHGTTAPGGMTRIMSPNDPRTAKKLRG